MKVDSQRRQLLGTSLLAATLLAVSAAEQAAVRAGTQMRGSCPLVVPPRDAELQPLRLRPSQVPRKNARGCLSPADAVYAADGCPERLCGRNAGVIQLPPP
ncbi:MAG: hypothetical protein VKI63_02695 [Cyanobium sp.]|nr:hypothetical protein [Cyanobium sp.]